MVKTVPRPEDSFRFTALSETVCGSQMEARGRDAEANVSQSCCCLASSILTLYRVFRQTRGGKNDQSVSNNDLKMRKSLSEPQQPQTGQTLQGFKKKEEEIHHDQPFARRTI